MSRICIINICYNMLLCLASQCIEHQHIKLNGSLSLSVSVPFGVPQGSVLGPLLFVLYTTPLSSVINSFHIPHHLYADASQLYASFSANDSADSLSNLQACLDSIQKWMLSNKLKLNPDKTEFLLIGHEQQRKKYMSQFPLSLMGVETNPSKSAKNLGVTLILIRISSSDLIFLRYAGHVSTRYVTSAVFVATLAWKIQRLWQIPW